MASYYGFEVISNKKLDVILSLHTLTGVLNDDMDRLYTTNEFNVRNLSFISMAGESSTRGYINNEHGVVIKNPDRSKRTYNMFVDLMNSHFITNGTEYKFKKGLSSFCILTSTRHDDTMDMDVFFDKLAQAFIKNFPDQEITILLRNDNNDHPEENEIIGDINNITDEGNND